MVDVVAESAPVEGLIWRSARRIRRATPPDNSALQIGKPPDPSEFILCPEILVPRIQNIIQALEGLGPGDVKVWYTLDGDFDDDAKSAERKECCPEQLRVFSLRACDQLGVGQQDGQGSDRLGDQ